MLECVKLIYERCGGDPLRDEKPILPLWYAK
jgi:hypothetical protein